MRFAGTTITHGCFCLFRPLRKSLKLWSKSATGTGPTQHLISPFKSRSTHLWGFGPITGSTGDAGVPVIHLNLPWKEISHRLSRFRLTPTSFGGFKKKKKKTHFKCRIYCQKRAGTTSRRWVQNKHGWRGSFTCKGGWHYLKDAHCYAPERMNPASCLNPEWKCEFCLSGFFYTCIEPEEKTVV